MTTANEKISEIVQRITGHMNIQCQVTVEDAGDAPVHVNIQAPEDAKFLIGKDGQNLKALEHVVRVAWMRQTGHARAVTVDVNDYRKSRATQITELVQQAAHRVRNTQRSEALPPMTSYERRIVHTELASWSDLASESVGQDPQRRVVIKPL